jgi:hypothetical protein
MDIAAAPGMVISQVMTISPALPQRTAFGRSDAPMPMMEEATTWVVETVAPNTDEAKITLAAVR